jgi:hypothetical protein
MLAEQTVGFSRRLSAEYLSQVRQAESQSIVFERTLDAKRSGVVRGLNGLFSQDLGRNPAGPPLGKHGSCLSSGDGEGGRGGTVEIIVVSKAANDESGDDDSELVQAGG